MKSLAALSGLCHALLNDICKGNPPVVAFRDRPVSLQQSPVVA